jgi:hypothetical protein
MMTEMASLARLAWARDFAAGSDDERNGDEKTKAKSTTEVFCVFWNRSF